MAGAPPFVHVPGLGGATGLSTLGTDEFRGLPFALPPDGERRFLPPQPLLGGWDAGSWARAGVAAPRKVDAGPAGLDGTRYGPACLRAEGLSTFTSPEPETSEDCLFLNVALPHGHADAVANGSAPLLPVVFWLHGGAFIMGSGANPALSPPPHALVSSRAGIVYVSSNYRLGILGYLASSALPSNGGLAGIEDQIAALQWVHDHIAAFGGDPGRVTLQGESAGAMSICLLLVMPASRHLFHKVILQSGLCSFPFATTEKALEATHEIVHAVGCGAADGHEEKEVGAASPPSLTSLAAFWTSLWPAVEPPTPAPSPLFVPTPTEPASVWSTLTGMAQLARPKTWLPRAWRRGVGATDRQGYTPPVWTPEQRAQDAAELACLRATPAEVLLSHLRPRRGIFFYEGAVITPVIDGMRLPDHPLHMIARGQVDIRGREVLFGHNADEASVFVAMAWPLLVSHELVRPFLDAALGPHAQEAYDVYIADGGHEASRVPASGAHTLRIRVKNLLNAMWSCASHHVADLLSARGALVRVYEWRHVPSSLSQRWEWLGAFHGSELDAVFGLWRPAEALSLDAEGATAAAVTADVFAPPAWSPTAEEVALAAHTMRLWAEFITGKRLRLAEEPGSPLLFVSDESEPASHPPVLPDDAQGEVNASDWATMTLPVDAAAVHVSRLEWPLYGGGGVGGAAGVGPHHHFDGVCLLIVAPSFTIAPRAACRTSEVCAFWDRVMEGGRFLRIPSPYAEPLLSRLANHHAPRILSWVEKHLAAINVALVGIVSTLLVALRVWHLYTPKGGAPPVIVPRPTEEPVPPPPAEEPAASDGAEDTLSKAALTAPFRGLISLLLELIIVTAPCRRPQQLPHPLAPSSQARRLMDGFEGLSPLWFAAAS